MMARHVSPVARTLAASALANAGASVVLVVRNLLDAYYAAQLSAAAMAALTVTVPVSLLLIGLSQGISVVTSNTLARSRKQALRQEGALVVHAAATALLAGALVALALLLIFPLGVHHYVADSALAGRARQLCAGIAAGAPLLFFYGTLTASLRGLGRASAAARATMLGLGTGAACTGWLMLGPWRWFDSEPLLAIPLGLAIGYALAIGIAIRELKYPGVCHGRPSWRQGWHDAGLIARGALPVMATNLAGLAAMFVVIGMVGSAGVDTTAAFGTVYRIEQFGMIVLNGIVLALVPLAARHLDDAPRLRQVVVTALLLQLAASVVLGGALALAAPWIGRLFQLPAPATELVLFWLLFAGVALFFQSVIMALTALLQLRHSKLALLINCVRLYCCLLPLLWLATQFSSQAIYPVMSCVHVACGGTLLFVMWRREHHRAKLPASCGMAGPSSV